MLTDIRHSPPGVLNRLVLVHMQGEDCISQFSRIKQIPPATDLREPKVSAETRTMHGDLAVVNGADIALDSVLLLVWRSLDISSRTVELSALSKQMVRHSS